MPLAAKSQERAWMATAIDSIEAEAQAASQEPKAMMVNRVVEIDEASRCSHHDYP